MIEVNALVFHICVAKIFALQTSMFMIMIINKNNKLINTSFQFQEVKPAVFKQLK